MSIRVRFAPSPTGDPHIGSIWTALMNWLFARKNNGVLVLRIEDTDQARFVQGSSERIIEMLTWYGLDYDEGPYIENPKQIQNYNFQNTAWKDKGGYGPYVQSKRLSKYQKYADMLMKNGSAYYCFCSEMRLAELRKAAEAAKQSSKYDRHCIALDPKEIERRKGNDEKFVVRLKIPEGTTIFTDLIRGKIEFKNELIDDQVLMKSDGFPTYHLANVVDDHEMKISHVIRAEEWLSSTPKHLILYEAFGWKPPQFAHLPLILGPDRSKLSKRHGATGALAFRDEGYLPEAMVNFLALLGWSSGTDQEIFSREELVKAFTLAGINTSGAIFNREKLDWMNGMYVRKLSLSEFADCAKPFLPDANNERAFIEKALATVQERVKRLSELPLLTHFYFKRPEYTTKLLLWKNEAANTIAGRLSQLVTFYEQSSFLWDEKTLEQETKNFIQQEGFQTGVVLWPMRVALSGEKASPSPFQIAAVLGKEETIDRIIIAMDKFQAAP